MDEEPAEFESLTQAQPLDWSPSYGSDTDELESQAAKEDIPDTDTDATILPTEHFPQGAGQDIKNMSISELGVFLHSKGIPDEYCEVFKSEHFVCVCVCVWKGLGGHNHVKVSTLCVCVCVCVCVRVEGVRWA